MTNWRRHRKDHNQDEIVGHLRKLGATVHVLSQAGDGVPDLLVGFRGLNILIECKVEGSDLSMKQREWFRNWTGQATVCHSARQAENIILELTSESLKSDLRAVRP